MKRILDFSVSLAVTLALAACVSCKGTSDDKPNGKSSAFNPADYDAVTTKGTCIRTGTADPCLLYNGGTFFLTMTGSTRLGLVMDKDLNSLTTSAHSTTSNIIYDGAKDANVEAMYGKGAKLDGTWSPEIHIITNDDCPGYAGTYLVLALKQKLDDARNVRTVVLKSSTGAINGPYVHPVTGVESNTQTLLDKDGKPITFWNIGMSLLRIPSGKYQGLYGTYVDEVGRGTGVKGAFYQRLRIAKLKTPWQLATDLSTITTPTQDWEKKGSSSTYPEVVEGGTAVYGDNGEIFLAYCGSGYWSDYGLGQLTLKREGGDYCDPLKSESWIKYDKNPLFTSAYSNDLRGAGHAFFLKDDAGNRFMVYHAYDWNGSAKGSRHAYIEPYSIDYSKKTETSPDGVIVFGANGNKMTAPVNTPITFYKKKKK